MKTRKILAVILAVAMLAGLAMSASATTPMYWNPETGWWFRGGATPNTGGIIYWTRHPASEFPYWEFGNTVVSSIDFTLTGTFNSTEYLGAGGFMFFPGVAPGMEVTLMYVNNHGQVQNLQGHGSNITGTVQSFTVNNLNGFNVSRHAPGGGFATEAARLIEINEGTEDRIDSLVTLNNSAAGAVFAAPDFTPATAGSPSSLAPGGAGPDGGEGVFYTASSVSASSQIAYGQIGQRTVRIVLRFDGDALDRLEDALGNIANPDSDVTALAVQTSALINVGIEVTGGTLATQTAANNARYMTANEGRIVWNTNWGTNQNRTAKSATVVFTNHSGVLNNAYFIPGGQTGDIVGLVNPFSTQEMREIAAAARTGSVLRVTAILGGWRSAGQVYQLRVGKLFGGDSSINQLQWLPHDNFDRLIFDIPADVIADATFDWNLAWLGVYRLQGVGNWGSSTFNLLRGGAPSSDQVVAWTFEVLLGDDIPDGPNLPFGYIKGDLSGNGRVDAMDALMALEIATRFGGAASAEDIIIGDINEDGKITAFDALEILKMVVGATDA